MIIVEIELNWLGEKKLHVSHVKSYCRKKQKERAVHTWYDDKFDVRRKFSTNFNDTVSSSLWYHCMATTFMVYPFSFPFKIIFVTFQIE